MAYIVKCPQCNEINGGSLLHCVKCQASLIGIPREDDDTPETNLLSTVKTADSEEESMEDVPVRTTKSLSEKSLLLGIPAVLALPIVSLLWELFEFDEDGFFIFCLVPGLWLTSVVCGLAGLITGFIALKRETDEKWKPVVGVVLGILMILEQIILFYLITSS